LALKIWGVALMSPKSFVQQSPQEQEEVSVEQAEVIRADAFDQFIEEQLQKVRSNGEQSDTDVVCHVY